MYHEPKSAAIAKWGPLLKQGLADDQWFWDWTARGQTPRAARAQLVAKSSGVWACSGLVTAAAAVFSEVEIKSDIEQGASFKSGQVLLKWSGVSQELLALERPFLNLAGYACAVATETKRCVDAVQRLKLKVPPRVTLTRKTLPHYRDVAIEAVLAGGGYPHRVSLSGGVLIKENHIAAAGSVSRAIEGVRDSAPHGLKIECEVRSVRELDAALRAGADVVLLDNFSPEQLTEALAHLSKWTSAGAARPVVEVSGGVRAETVERYARDGVDVISIGALTHSPAPVDLSLLFSASR